jgi:hypothetical protein
MNFSYSRNDEKMLGIVFTKTLYVFRENITLFVRKVFAAVKLLYNHHLVTDFKLGKKLCRSLISPYLLHSFPVFSFVWIYYVTTDSENDYCRFVCNLQM